MTGEWKEDTVTIIPAHPGWNVLHPYAETHGGPYVGFHREPVIAWRVELGMTFKELNYFTTAYPVTVESTRDDDPLQRPDGSIVIPMECEFEDEDQALRYLTKERRGDQ